MFLSEKGSSKEQKRARLKLQEIAFGDALSETDSGSSSSSNSDSDM